MESMAGITQPKLLAVRFRIGRSKAERLAWAVAFTTEDLNRLSGRGLLRRQVELMAFAEPQPTFSPKRGAREPIPSVDELRRAQQRLRSILEAFVNYGRAELGQGRVVVGRTASSTWLTTQPTLDDLETDATFTLGRLLEVEGRRVKRCEAPSHVRRREPAKPCGRWFVGRPNQRHCSPRCANLASTRSARFGRAEIPYRGYVIRGASRQLPDGNWQAAAEYTGEEEDVQVEPPRRFFKTKEKADEIATKFARAIIDARASAKPSTAQ